MAQIKINNMLYSTISSAEINYHDTTLENKLDNIINIDTNDNSENKIISHNNLTYGHIINSLNSEYENKALSAQQGKKLKENIDNIDFSSIENNILNFEIKLENTIENVNNQINELNTFKNNFLNLVYPIGTIYMTADDASPSSLFGGIWESVENKFLLGAGSSYIAGETGGSATHTLTINELPNHQHQFPFAGNDTAEGASGQNQFNFLYGKGQTASAMGQKTEMYNETSSNAAEGNELAYMTNKIGGSQSHNNMPPYLTIKIWKRVG